MQKRPTIVDVARQAGVSRSTVSLVLQNSPLVREETRVQVREAMAKIGYVYNRAAANLRSTNVGLIGLVINDLRNPFFGEFATAFQMSLFQRGYTTVVANADEDPSLQARIVASMIEHGVSALVISPAYGEEALTFAPLARAGIPTMQVLRKVNQKLDVFPFAAPEYRLGSRLATEHLLEAGSRQIAFVGGLEDRAVTSERMSGYLEAISHVGMPPVVLNGRPTRAFGHEAAFRVHAMQPRVDACLCFNDLVALGMLTGCAEAGIAVARDLKIVGFDGIEECNHAWPRLTTVGCDISGFAAKVSATLVDWIENGEVPAPEVRTIVRLIVQGSTG